MPEQIYQYTPKSRAAIESAFLELDLEVRIPLWNDIYKSLVLRYPSQQTEYDDYTAAVETHVANLVAEATAAEKTEAEIAVIAKASGIPSMVYDWMADKILDAVVAKPAEAQAIISAHQIPFSIWES